MRKTEDAEAKRRRGRMRSGKGNKRAETGERMIK